MWDWLQDTEHMLTGLVIEDRNGYIQGLAHYHAWPVSIYGCDVCYLSDLYVNSEVRGQKLGKVLYEYILEECKTRLACIVAIDSGRQFCGSCII